MDIDRDAPNPGGAIDLSIDDFLRLYGISFEEMRWFAAMSLYKYAAVLGTLAPLAFSLEYLTIPLERLPGLLGRMGEMLARRYFPPNVGHILNAEYLHTVVETLQMSYLATVLGIAAAIPLAWFAAYNMTPSRRFLYPVARLFIMACRSVHEMIWTILLVALLGFGMLPGALALTLFCIVSVVVGLRLCAWPLGLF